MALDGTPRTIIRWESFRPICGKDWHLRIVWSDHYPGRGLHSPRPEGGMAWFRFGPVGEEPRTFQMPVSALTDDLSRQFVKMAVYVAERF